MLGTPISKRSSVRVKAFVLAPILLVLALAAWALSSPMGASPDDDFHLASIWCGLGDRGSLCEPGTTADQRTVPEDLTDASICYQMKPDVSASCQEQEFSSRLSSTERGNFTGLYPPFYYGFMSVFASPSLEVSAIVMRIVDAVVFVGVTSVLYLLLPIRRRNNLLMMWAVSVVPLGMFIIASNNPSGWAILSAGSTWLALVGYFETDGPRRWWLGGLAVLTALMGAGSRADAAMYNLVAIAAVFVLTAERTKSFWLKMILPAVIAIGSVLLYFSTTQSQASVDGLSHDGPLQGISRGMLAIVNFFDTPNLWQGVFGGWGLGWLDTSTPALVSVGGVAVFGAIVFAGLRSVSWRKCVAVLGVFAVAWLLPAYLLVQSETFIGRLVQPRYVFPVLVLGAGVALFAVDRRWMGFTKVQLFVVGAFLALANSLALHSNIRRYVTGADVRDWNLNRSIEWWWNMPISPMVVWGIGTLAFAGVVILVMREVFRNDRETCAPDVMSVRRP